MYMLDITDLSLVLSLGSALFAAGASVLARYLLQFATTREYLGVGFALLFVQLLPFVPFFFVLQTTGVAVAAILLVSLVDGVANYFYFKAFEIQDASTASSLLALSPLFALLVAPFVGALALASPGGLDSLGVVGVLAVVAGVITINRAITAPAATGERAPASRWYRLVVPLVSSLLFGVNAYGIKYILTQEYANPFTYYLIRAFVVMVLAFALFRPSFDWLNRRVLLIGAGRAVFVIAQWMLLLYALGMGNPPLVKAVSETTPLFVILLSLFAGEQVTRHTVAGGVLIVAGLVAMGV
jgi:drug/metabolite transporter (DMT)-like permease